MERIVRTSQREFNVKQRVKDVRAISHVRVHSSDNSEYYPFGVVLTNFAFLFFDIMFMSGSIFLFQLENVHSPKLTFLSPDYPMFKAILSIKTIVLGTRTP